MWSIYCNGVCYNFLGMSLRYFISFLIDSCLHSLNHLLKFISEISCKWAVWRVDSSIVKSLIEKRKREHFFSLNRESDGLHSIMFSWFFSTCTDYSFMIQVTAWSWVERNVSCTAQKMKFPIKDFFSRCDQIHMKMQILSQLMKKSLMKTFIFLQCSWSQTTKLPLLSLSLTTFCMVVTIQCFRLLCQHCFAWLGICCNRRFIYPSN